MRQYNINILFCSILFQRNNYTVLWSVHFVSFHSIFKPVLADRSQLGAHETITCIRAFAQQNNSKGQIIIWGGQEQNHSSWRVTEMYSWYKEVPTALVQAQMANNSPPVTDSNHVYQQQNSSLESCTISPFCWNDDPSHTMERNAL